jgi:hypothetical protein
MMSRLPGDSDGGRFPRHPPVAVLPGLAHPRSPHQLPHGKAYGPPLRRGVTFIGQAVWLAVSAACLSRLSRPG